MTKPKKYLSKEQRGGSRWAAKVLGALAVPAQIRLRSACKVEGHNQGSLCPEGDEVHPVSRSLRREGSEGS